MYDWCSVCGCMCMYMYVCFVWALGVCFVMHCCLSLFLYIYVFVELICTLWAYFPCQNHFLNDFIVLIDLENVGVVTSLARFGHDFTKLYMENGFCSQVMCKNLSDPKYPTRTLFDPNYLVRKSWPELLHNGGTNLHTMGILPLTLSISNCFFKPWHWHVCH